MTILGTVLPPLSILSGHLPVYQAFRDNLVVSAVLQGMQAGVAAVIVDVVLSMGWTVLREKQWVSAVIMVGAFAATYVFQVNILLIILVCGVTARPPSSCAIERGGTPNALPAAVLELFSNRPVQHWRRLRPPCPLIQNQVVDLHHWLTLSEFTDLITISQMTPGPIAINSATFVGIRIGGVGGALVSTLGCILPSLIIVMTLAYFYTKYKNIAVIQGVLSGLRPAVVALIASAGLSIVILAFWGEGGFSLKPADLNLAAVGLFAAGLFVLRKWKPTPSG